ncbi:MAG: hypothetical protein J6Q05_05605, partial [Elusimicrobiaceae bacterium]|nr:hypothetical protein [Elusimicrobiaceae bacterium]
MKKCLCLLLIGCALNVHAAQTCDINAQKPIELLSAQLKRSMQTLKKQNPPIYYLSYTYTEQETVNLIAQDGALSREQISKEAFLQVFPRAGSTRLDNTRTLKKDRTYYTLTNVNVPLWREDPHAFTTAVWAATEQAVEEAQQDFNRVKADAQTASTRADDSPDFVFPPKETFCLEEPPLSFDLTHIKGLLVKASRLTTDKPFVLESEFNFSMQSTQRYFVDSVGTRLKFPVRLARLNYILSGQSADGAKFVRSGFYDVLDQAQLPSEEKLLADVAQSIRELEALSKAPETDPITVPAILKNRAMAVFVHEVLGHRVEGHRQKEDSFGKTFTDKMGQQVVSPLLTIVDDATLSSFNNIPLRGFYYYDDEGVKARPVVLVENGILKNFLMSSSPVKGFAVSNGHGRGAAGKRPVARMGNTRVIASQTVSYEQLEKQLLAEIRRQNAPYGVIIEDLSGGFTLTQTSFP